MAGRDARAYGDRVSTFVICVETAVPPAEAWERLWDLDAHTRHIPLTHVALDPPARELAEGAGFTGRTGIGRIAFDDSMRVLAWSPPSEGEGGCALVVKTGRVVGGRIEVRVDPLRSGARVRWRQEVRLPWLPARLRLLEGLAARLAAPGYRRVLRTVLA